MAPHSWTSRDEKTWRKLARLAARVLMEPKVGGFEPALGDLAAACRPAFSALLPAQSEYWPALMAFLKAASGFSGGDEAHRERGREAFIEQVRAAYAILGLELPDGLVAPGFVRSIQAPVDGQMRPPGQPYYLRD